MNFCVTVFLSAFVAVTRMVASPFVPPGIVTVLLGSSTVEDDLDSLATLESLLDHFKVMAILSSSESYTVALNWNFTPSSGSLFLSMTAVWTASVGLDSKWMTRVSYPLALILICAAPADSTFTLTVLVIGLSSLPNTLAVISACPFFIAWIVPSFDTVAIVFFVDWKVILELGMALLSALTSVRNILEY